MEARSDAVIISISVVPAMLEEEYLLSPRALATRSAIEGICTLFDELSSVGPTTRIVIGVVAECEINIINQSPSVLLRYFTSQYAFN